MSNGAEFATLNADSNNAIEVRDLTKYYGRLGQGVLAVDHISFVVRRSEVFGFLGPNGAGKTTAQRMLTTLLEPTEGRIFINGHDLAHDTYPVKRQIGLVPEESNVYTELTAWGNLVPIYEYQCKECGKGFEKPVRSISTALKVECPHCGGKEVKKAFSLLGTKSSSPDGLSASTCAPSG